MHRSPSPLPHDARQRLAEALDARLADALDLASQLRVARWNLKGPHLPLLRPWLGRLAGLVARHADAFAVRATTLGGLAHGTARHVAARSTLPEYPPETTRDTEHARLVADRLELFLDRLRHARTLAEGHGDRETSGLLADAIAEVELRAGWLRATLEA
jgi:starvation-inducible DNA-binding protein